MCEELSAFREPMYKNGRVQGAYTTLPFCDCTCIARAHWALPSPIARAHGHFPSAKWKNPWARANEMEVPSGRVQLKWKCPVGACNWNGSARWARALDKRCRLYVPLAAAFYSPPPSFPATSAGLSHAFTPLCKEEWYNPNIFYLKYITLVTLQVCINYKLFIY